MIKKQYKAISTIYSLSEEKFKEFFQKAFNGMRLSRAFVTHKERKTYNTTTDQAENSAPNGTIVFNDRCTVTLPNVSGKELYSFLAGQKTIEDDLLGKYEISTFTTYQSIVTGNSRLRTSPVIFDSKTEKDWSPYTAEGREKIYKKIKSVLNEEDEFISSFFKRIAAVHSDTPFIVRSYKSRLISDSNNEIDFQFSFVGSDFILKLVTIFEVNDDSKYNNDRLKAIGKGKLEDLSSRFVKDLDIDTVEIVEDGDFTD